MASPQPTKPTFEHHHNGIGLGISNPRISWRFMSADDTVRSWIQTAYEIEVQFSDSERETHKVGSNQCILVPWPSRLLASRERASVRIRVHGKASSFEGSSEWSETAIVEAALLNKSDFKGHFIASAEEIGEKGPLQPRCFRKEFIVPDLPNKARLYITALGVFKAYINDVCVSDEEMAPGWTSYKHRLIYRVWEVMLRPGENVIEIEAAEGWYSGRLGFKGGKRFHYGDDIAVFAQLEIGDWTLVTDNSWSCRTTAIRQSEIYDGEIYELNHSSIQTPTTHIPWPAAKLVAADTPPVRVTETKPTLEIFKSKSGKTIIDFGQNLVGKLQVKNLIVNGQVTFIHAEVMEHGELGTRPLRIAKCTDTVIGKGNLDLWSPQFTFHGFRYCQVEGWTPRKEDISALVMHTDMKRRGHFSSSNQSVNQLHQNVVWSMRGNFLSIATDCPARDERLGWTGDLQVFCPTASFLYDTVGMLGEWMQDVAAEQRNGIPPLVVPDVIPPNWPHIPQAVWDDVLVLTPDVLYQYSADKTILERQFHSMQSWLEEGIDRVDGLWNPDRWQLGDWLDPAAPPEEPGDGRTDSILVANAYLIHVTDVFSRICGVLDKTELQMKYAKETTDLKAKFHRKYITPEGQLMSSSQTAISLAIQYGIVEGAQRISLTTTLDRLVRAARFHISTGFAGTPIICHALTNVGLVNLAYRMLLEKTCPSWMYPVSMGATTIWERWNSMLPNGDINPGEMTSFNHYALGAVADWLHSTVGGISPADVGWKVIRCRPTPGGNLTSADVSFDGPYGVVSCSWTLTSRKHFEMTLVVPPNSTAEVRLPSERLAEGGEQIYTIVRSGSHHFECEISPEEWPPKPFIPAMRSMPKDEIAT